MPEDKAQDAKGGPPKEPKLAPRPADAEAAHDQEVGEAVRDYLVGAERELQTFARLLDERTAMALKGLSSAKTADETRAAAKSVGELRAALGQDGALAVPMWRVRQAVTLLNTWEDDYLSRKKRLELERARADVAAATIGAYPIAVRGKFLSQVGTTLLAAGATGVGAAIALGGGWLGLVPISIAGIGLGILAFGLNEMGEREKAQVAKAEEFLDNIRVIEPPKRPHFVMFVQPPVSPETAAAAGVEVVHGREDGDKVLFDYTVEDDEEDRQAKSRQERRKGPDAGAKGKP